MRAEGVTRARVEHADADEHGRGGDGVVVALDLPQLRRREPRLAEALEPARERVTQLRDRRRAASVRSASSIAASSSASRDARRSASFAPDGALLDGIAEHARELETRAELRLLARCDRGDATSGALAADGERARSRRLHLAARPVRARPVRGRHRYLTVIENGTATTARSPSASGARLATKGTRSGAMRSMTSIGDGATAACDAPLGGATGLERIEEGRLRADRRDVRVVRQLRELARLRERRREAADLVDEPALLPLASAEDLAFGALGDLLARHRATARAAPLGDAREEELVDARHALEHARARRVVPADERRLVRGARAGARLLRVGGERLGVDADLLERVADADLAADDADRPDDAHRLGEDEVARPTRGTCRRSRPCRRR